MHVHPFLIGGVPCSGYREDYQTELKTDLNQPNPLQASELATGTVSDREKKLIG